MLFLLLAALSTPVHALEKSWFLGIGTGLTRLKPDTLSENYIVEEDGSESIHIVLGYDASQTSSFELVLSDLGAAELSGGTDVKYSSAVFTGLYRFYDWRESNRNAMLDINFFGKLGLGYLNLDTDAPIEINSRVHMLAAIGAELDVFNGVSLRGEIGYIDVDAQIVSLSLIKRFRFLSRNPVRSHVEASMAPRTPKDNLDSGMSTIQTEPPMPNHIVEYLSPGITEPVNELLDGDSDGISDDKDECVNSNQNYPVRNNGCSLLSGVIRNIEFASYSAELTEKTKAVLTGLAKLFKRFPQARVQVSSHTITVGNESKENELTRRRLRNIALYMRSVGVVSSQVKYMAFGARVADAKGEYSDRIEIKEIPK